MSFYTGKIQNTPESGQCGCYMKAEYKTKWDKLDNSTCNMCGKKGKMDIYLLVRRIKFLLLHYVQNAIDQEKQIGKLHKKMVVGIT